MEDYVSPTPLDPPIVVIDAYRYDSSLILQVLEDEEMGESMKLERGENLFEIHVSKVVLSSDAVLSINERDPALFVTFAFFDFELMSTPIVRGVR